MGKLCTQLVLYKWLLTWNKRAPCEDHSTICEASFTVSHQGRICHEFLLIQNYDLPTTNQQSPTQPSSMPQTGLCLGNLVLSPSSGMLISLIFLIAVSFTLASCALSSERSLLFFSLFAFSFPLGFSLNPQFPSFLQHLLSYLKSSLFIYHVTPPRTYPLHVLLIFKYIIHVLHPQISKYLK